MFFKLILLKLLIIMPKIAPSKRIHVAPKYLSNVEQSVIFRIQKEKSHDQLNQNLQLLNLLEGIQSQSIQPFSIGKNSPINQQLIQGLPYCASCQFQMTYCIINSQYKLLPKCIHCEQISPNCLQISALIEHFETHYTHSYTRLIQSINKQIFQTERWLHNLKKLMDSIIAIQLSQQPKNENPNKKKGILGSFPKAYLKQLLIWLKIDTDAFSRCDSIKNELAQSAPWFKRVSHQNAHFKWRPRMKAPKPHCCHLVFDCKKTWSQMDNIFSGLSPELYKMGVIYDFKANAYLSAEKYPILSSICSLPQCRKLQAQISNLKDQENLLDSLKCVTSKLSLELHITLHPLVPLPTRDSTNVILEMLQRLGPQITHLRLELPLVFKIKDIEEYIIRHQFMKLVDLHLKGIISEKMSLPFQSIIWARKKCVYVALTLQKYIKSNNTINCIIAKLI